MLKILVLLNLLVGLPLWIGARATDNMLASVGAGYLIASAVVVMVIMLPWKRSNGAPIADSST